MALMIKPGPEGTTDQVPWFWCHKPCRGNMTIAHITKGEADVMALKLFCLFSFILVGLIMAIL
jgi:hypothetical protein